MKKNIILLGVLATLLFALPIQVSAVSFTEDDPHVSTESIPMGKYGSIQAGDYTWTYSNEEDGIKTWTITLEVNDSIDYVYFTLSPQFLTIDSVNTAPGSDYIYVTQVSNGNNINVFFEKTGSGNTLELTVITTDDPVDDGCILNVSPINTLDCSTSIPGFYFDNDGNSISQEEYNEVCGNTTTTTPETPGDIPNSPQTGSVVPYIAIGGGLLAIVVVYLLTRKNKVYKI